MKKTIYIATLLFCLLSKPWFAVASNCQIANPDFEKDLRNLNNINGIISKSGVDPDSDEPFTRNFVVFNSGELAIIEQKNCLIWNLTISLHSFGNLNQEKIIDMLTQLTAVTPLTKQFYAAKNIKEELLLGLKEAQVELTPQATFSKGIDVLSPKNESSEVIIENQPINADFINLYQQTTNLYIGVGGMD